MLKCSKHYKNYMARTKSPEKLRRAHQQRKQVVNTDDDDTTLGDIGLDDLRRVEMVEAARTVDGDPEDVRARYQRIGELAETYASSAETGQTMSPQENATAAMLEMLRDKKITWTHVEVIAATQEAVRRAVHNTEFQGKEQEITEAVLAETEIAELAERRVANREAGLFRESMIAALEIYEPTEIEEMRAFVFERMEQGGVRQARAEEMWTKHEESPRTKRQLAVEGVLKKIDNITISRKLEKGFKKGVRRLLIEIAEMHEYLIEAMPEDARRILAQLLEKAIEAKLLSLQEALARPDANKVLKSDRFREQQIDIINSMVVAVEMFPEIKELAYEYTEIVYEAYRSIHRLTGEPAINDSRERLHTFIVSQGPPELPKLSFFQERIAKYIESGEPLKGGRILTNIYEDWFAKPEDLDQAYFQGVCRRLIQTAEPEIAGSYNSPWKEIVEGVIVGTSLRRAQSNRKLANSYSATMRRQLDSTPEGKKVMQYSNIVYRRGIKRLLAEKEKAREAEKSSRKQ